MPEVRWSCAEDSAAPGWRPESLEWRHKRSPVPGSSLQSPAQLDYSRQPAHARPRSRPCVTGSRRAAATGLRGSSPKPRGNLGRARRLQREGLTGRAEGLPPLRLPRRQRTLAPLNRPRSRPRRRAPATPAIRSTEPRFPRRPPNAGPVSTDGSDKPPLVPLSEVRGQQPKRHAERKQACDAYNSLQHASASGVPDLVASASVASPREGSMSASRDRSGPSIPLSTLRSTASITLHRIRSLS